MSVVDAGVENAEYVLRSVGTDRDVRRHADPPRSIVDPNIERARQTIAISTVDGFVGTNVQLRVAVLQRDEHARAVVDKRFERRFEPRHAPDPEARELLAENLLRSVVRTDDRSAVVQ